MTGPFAFSAHMHHPVVKNVFRLPQESRGLLSIQLGDPTGYSHVSLLVTDEEWRAIARDVDTQIARLDAQDDCPECGKKFDGNESADELTEHVFAEHPEAVAR